MKKNILLAIGVAGLAVASASAKSYSVQLFEPAVLTSGKVHCEAPVKVESADSKYSSTTVRFSNGDGKMHIQEIHLGGTKTKLVFNE